MPIKKRKRKTSSKKLQKGTVGYFFIFGTVAVLIAVGLAAVGGIPSVTFPEDGTEVILVTPTKGPAHSTLQLQEIGFSTIAPTQPPASSQTLCKQGGVNSEPEIFAGYVPSAGHQVGTDDQIKVWVEDEGAPFISPGEIVDASSGKITTPGQRTAKAPDGLIWEPALYIAPQIAEKGGTPHFPDLIKGDFSNSAPLLGKVIHGAAMDPIPAGQTKLPGPQFGVTFADYTAEYIWNTSSLGLKKGTVQVEFIVHDGDRDHGVLCIPIQVE